MTLTDTLPLPVRRAPAGTARLFRAVSASAPDHLAAYGPLPELGFETLVTQLEISGLTGRGGAGFPAWRKTAALLHRGGIARRAVVIANGAEGEPLSGKDALLCTRAPHLVIDGLLAVARALETADVHAYAGPVPLAALRAAAAERTDAARLRFTEAPDAFVAGEASAVVRAIERGRALPSDRIVRLTESGLGRRPTVVHNVETLAHIALAARFGGRWFRSIGSDRRTGTRLVTVTGDVPRPGVFEVAADASIGEVLAAQAPGGAAPDVRAVLVGGYHGEWIAGDAASEPVGGAGIVHVVGPGSCGAAVTAEVVDHLAAESAGQCGPCRLGLPEIARRYAVIARGGGGPASVRELTALAAEVEGRGSCHHPDGSVRLVRSALSVFAGESEEHAAGRCSARAR